MEKFKEIAGPVWRKYRGLPGWAQIVIGFVVLSIALGPFLGDDNKSKAASEETTTTEREPETTTTERTATTGRETTTTEKSAPSLEDRVDASNDGTLLISRNDFGDEWPLSVPEGLLSCRPVEGDTVAIVFGTDDTAYAVNGIARGRADDEGWHEVDEIWLDNPAAPGTKMNIGPLIDLGLRLCN